MAWLSLDFERSTVSANYVIGIKYQVYQILINGDRCIDFYLLVVGISSNEGSSFDLVKLDRRSLNENLN